MQSYSLPLCCAIRILVTLLTVGDEAPAWGQVAAAPLSTPPTEETIFSVCEIKQVTALDLQSIFKKLIPNLIPVAFVVPLRKRM
jgi:hypothetical protein